MGRAKGSRNQNFDETRGELAGNLARALLDERGELASLAAMAAAVGVTVPTLKHYFGDHDGVVTAALAAAEVAGKPHLEALGHPGRRKLDSSMREVVESLLAGWPLGVGALFAAALAHGLVYERRGRATVNHVLEPTIQALEQRLGVHRERGELARTLDLRTLALTFLSPLLVALLHQRELGGESCRPLEISTFARAHVAGWLRAWSNV